jgi:hypothetical protein
VVLSGIDVAVVGADEDVDLDAQELIVEVNREAARPALLLTDGESTVRVSTEIGSVDEAVDRLMRLAATALSIAEELRSSG